MTLGHTTRITSDDLRTILNRLKPYLPPNLHRIEPSPCGMRLRYQFAPFTGREDRPTTPADSYDDPHLRYVPESDNAAEHLLREAARHILSDIYSEAYQLWKDAAYIADLKNVVRDAPERWKAYEQALRECEAAYDHLRTPQAGAEWPAAISRLADTQDAMLTAATAFEDRDRDIAEVHAKHLYSELSPTEALRRAGYPAAGDWHGGSFLNGHRYTDGLHETALGLVDRQTTHVTKVGRLAGITTPLGGAR